MSRLASRRPSRESATPCFWYPRKFRRTSDPNKALTNAPGSHGAQSVTSASWKGPSKSIGPDCAAPLSAFSSG
jgi:hypothetical protein